MPLSSKDRLWLFVTAAVTCAAALTWPLLAWIATGRMSAYVDTETAWRGVDLAHLKLGLTALLALVAPTQVLLACLGCWCLACAC